MKMPTKTKSETEDDFDFDAYAENLSDMVSFMLRSKKFGKEHGDLQRSLRDKIQASLDAEGEDEEEPAEPPKTRADATKAFNRHNAMVLKDVRKRFQSR